MVIHDSENQVFRWPIEGGGEGTLHYRESSEKVLDFYSTQVPIQGRGQGIAGKLVEAGFEFAALKEMKVKPSCSYVAAYFERHPNWQHLRIANS